MRLRRKNTYGYSISGSTGFWITLDCLVALLGLLPAVLIIVLNWQQDVFGKQQTIFGGPVVRESPSRHIRIEKGQSQQKRNAPVTTSATGAMCPV
jgi:hypothetical protein